MEQSGESTAQQLGRSLMQINKSFFQFNREKLHQVFADHKPSEMRVLFIIREREKCGEREMKVSEISKMLHVTSPTVTQLIKSLEAGGLIERRINQMDRRAVGIVLTERGEQVAAKAEEIFITSFQALADYLGEEQSNQLVALLTKAINYFDEKEKSMSHLQWNGAEKS